MYNSDGYVLIDLTGVDITKTNQHLTGIYNRVLTVIDINKLALVINAGDLTPMAAVVHKKLNYYVINTPLYIFTINSNDIIMIEEAGEATVDVAIVPALLDGVKIADFTIGAVEGSLYAPEQQSEINDNITTDYTTWSSDKINNKLSDKADSSDVYTKAQVDTALSGKADNSDIPTKTSQLLNDSGFITSAQVPTIDDNTVASDKVWSSYKVSNELSNKANTSALTDYQPKTDNALATTDKTVVGAINELKSGKQDSFAMGSIGFNDLFTDTSNILGFDAYRIGKMVFITRLRCKGGTYDGTYINYGTFKSPYVPKSSTRLLWDKAGTGTNIIGYAESGGLFIKDSSTTSENYAYSFAFEIA